jgi:hypothetical protein
MNTPDQLLQSGQLKEAVDALRKRTGRNKPVGIVFGAIGIFYLWAAFHDGLTGTVDGKTVLLQGSLEFGLALVSILVGVRELFGHPPNRLLLFLAEDLLARKQDPNLAPEPALAPGVKP